MLRAEGLKKSYGERAAVIDVWFEVAAGEVLTAVGLADRAGDKPATFSSGMKRRLDGAETDARHRWRT